MDGLEAKISVLESRLKRQTRAREAAEELLEVKANELWAANQQLETLLAGKTQEVSVANEGLVAAEARLWDAISVLPGGFAVYDPSFALVTANTKYGSLIQDPDRVLLRGTPRYDVLDNMLQVCFPSLSNLERRRHIVREEERWDKGDFRSFDLQLDDGRWLHVTEARVGNGDYLHYFEDVTNDKTRENELEVAKLEAESSSRAKSAFLANMSHEIRTPMNGVVGMADLLSETALTPDQMLYAQTIRNSGEALLVIINDILDYSKIEANQMEIFPAPFDLEETVYEAITLLQSRARDKGLVLIFDYDLFLPIRFVGDAGRLRQVLLNLVGNAIKFTDEGFVTVRVVGMLDDSGQFDVRIAVEDTGIGISPEKLNLVFAEFKQADQDSTRRYEGTGLGLTITKKLVELMGGEVWADSVLGEGSVFGVRLPLELHSDAQDFMPKTDEVAKRYSKALIVDDLAQNRLILQKQMGQLGIDVVCASTARSAREDYRKDPTIDLILTDYLMPGESGADLARELRREGFMGTIVCLSSVSTAGIQAKDRDAFDHVLQKPVLRRDIFKSLGVLFGLSEEPSAIRQSLPDDEDDLRELDLIIAEDNKTNLLVLQRMLSGLNCAFRLAGNGRELMSEYHSGRPDAVITDISMPEMDGNQAIRLIREHEAQTGLSPVPIVVLTAHAMAGDEERFLETGADSYLSKPVKKAELVAQVEAIRDGTIRRTKDAPPSQATSPPAAAE
ncbi:MAG: response regulator [Pseudomonadota bacterium]